jgi:predicted phage gp36 major capsid-like protein
MAATKLTAEMRFHFDRIRRMVDHAERQIKRNDSDQVSASDALEFAKQSASMAQARLKQLAAR